ncbi:MAG: ornithine--oxo-acid transaminase [bacterium]|nr:ornithine--oxo-acid transaminase [bacterium]
MNKNILIQTVNKYCAHNYHPLDVVLSRGHGIWVYDTSGKKYMDFLSAYSALNQGHTHEKIIRAIKKQLNKITLTSRAFYNNQLGLFAKDLCKLTSFEMALPMNTGAEAVETAIKVARKWGYYKKGVKGGKAEIIVCQNNFHGRTISIISFSTEKQYRDGFGPYTKGFRIIKFNNLKAIKEAIGPNTVAVLLEPIQAEGGIIIPDKGYLTGVANICRKNNVLFMLDEIQTGLGRTGKLFAYEHDYNAKPDLLVVGKALGGGFYPVSAVLASRSIFEVITPGDHGSTFGGNPLGSAIARASLRVIVKENLVERSAELGRYFLSKLKTLQSKWIKEIRGKGLLIGIELHKEAGGARRFCEALMTEFLLCKETHEDVIRFAPPLIIKKGEIDSAFKIIKKVLENPNL